MNQTSNIFTQDLQKWNSFKYTNYKRRPRVVSLWYMWYKVSKYRSSNKINILYKNCWI